MQAILHLPLLTTPDTPRLVLSSCLGTALLTLSRSPAVLGIYLGQGEEVSVSRIQWDFPPFCPWDFFFLRQRKASFSSEHVFGPPWLLFLLRAQRDRIYFLERHSH